MCVYTCAGVLGRKIYILISYQLELYLAHLTYDNHSGLTHWGFSIFSNCDTYIVLFVPMTLMIIWLLQLHLNVLCMKKKKGRKGW